MMKLKMFLALVSCALLILISVQFAASLIPARKGFALNVPELIEAYPGEEVVVEGSITPTKTWMRSIYLFVEGLPFAYSIEPQYIDVLPVMYNYTPSGAYKIPKPFYIKFKVPEDLAEGNYTVKIIAQETLTSLRITNSTSFQLRINPTARFSVSEVLFPETVVENQPFNLSLTLSNEGDKEENVTVSLIVPREWVYTDGLQSLTLAPKSSSVLTFNITPANTSGLVSIRMEYPYKKTIMNITKLGPILIPEAYVEEVPVAPSFAPLVETLTPALVILSLIFLVLIAWNIFGIYRFYKTRQSEEVMKKGETA